MRSWPRRTAEVFVFVLLLFYASFLVPAYVMAVSDADLFVKTSHVTEVVSRYMLLPDRSKGDVETGVWYVRVSVSVA